MKTLLKISLLPGIVLSSNAPNRPPINIEVSRRIVNIWSSSVTPVSIILGFDLMYPGTRIPMKIENPRMNRFLEDNQHSAHLIRIGIVNRDTHLKSSYYLEEFKSKYCKLDKPTAVTIPNMTQNKPPKMGSGIRTNTAPILPMIPMKKNTTPVTWSTWIM